MLCRSNRISFSNIRVADNINTAYICPTDYVNPNWSDAIQDRCFRLSIFSSNVLYIKQHSGGHNFWTLLSIARLGFSCLRGGTLLTTEDIQMHSVIPYYYQMMQGLCYMVRAQIWLASILWIGRITYYNRHDLIHHNWYLSLNQDI